VNEKGEDSKERWGGVGRGETFGGGHLNYGRHFLLSLSFVHFPFHVCE